MTPQERQLIDDLFDRLSKLESAPRDPDAAAAIAQGLRGRAQRGLRAGADRAGAGRSAEARQQPHPGTGSRQRAATKSIRRVPRFDARHDLRTRPAARLGAECAAARDSQPPGLEQRPGAAAGPGRRGNIIRNRMARISRTVSSRPMVSPMVARRSRRWAEAAARFSAPRPRRQPAWSADRCCSAASAR